ncbi:MAG: winged helix-turn-helix domain-containing protein, partial [Gammaproteobacteria bacterium]|nr:winged helix-turn-helix domain-containing protein [Gammaproteobacteria bacterium]
RVTIDSQLLELGPTEFKLLRFFMNNSEKVFSRNQLLDRVWSRGSFIEERTVDVHIRRLRKALEPFSVDGYLQTVRGSGYRFSANTK